MPTCIYRTDPRLVAYWPGDGNTFDYTGHGHHGRWCTHDGDCSTLGAWGTGHTGGHAFWLSANIEDDDDLPDRFIFIPSSADAKNEFDETESFSLVFWMKDHTWSKFGLSETIVGKKATIYGPTASFGVTTKLEPRGVEQQVVNYISAAIQDVAIETFDESPGAYKWVHVAMISSGSKMSLYLDNQLVKSTTFESLQTPFTGFLAFGNSGLSFGRAFQPWASGLLDDVTFWNEDLTANDVNRLFLQGICPVTARGFWLIDTNKNKDIGPLEDGDTVDLGELPRDALSIRAFFVPAASVKIELWDDEQKPVHRQIENIEPYALFGHSGGKYTPGSIPLGDNSLTATVYSEKDAEGSVLDVDTIRFNVIATVFWLVDTNKNEDIGPLHDGDTVDISELSRDALTIRAFSVSAESVRLVLKNEYQNFVHRQTENIEPYALYGDSGGKYTPGPIPIGDNSLTATFYSENGANGSILNTLTIRFNLVDAAIVTPQPTPMPSTSTPVSTSHCCDNCLCGIVRNNALFP